ncbi:5066_t:CDS:1, partial [Funneliformis caledonium]
RIIPKNLSTSVHQIRESSIDFDNISAPARIIPRISAETSISKRSFN